LDLFDARENPFLPWEGDFSFFCEGMPENGAPCVNSELGEISTIDIDCNCSQISATGNIRPKAINIYPNPVHDMIMFSNCFECHSYILYKTDGMILSSGSLLKNQIDISQLVPGAYILKIEDSNHQSHVSRIIKY